MERTRSISLGILAILALVAPGFEITGQNNEKNGPEMLIKAASFLEQKPLDKEAKEIRGRALRWVIETDKVSVTVCSLLLSGTEEKYKYNSEIFAQYTLGMAAFKLANPDKTQDEAAVQLAGIESALRVYEAIVKEKPKAKHTFMDDLLAKRGDGSLAGYAAANNCREKKENR